MSMYRMRYISQTQCLRRQVVTRRGMSTRRTAAGTTQARPEGAGCVRFRLVVPVDLGRRARVAGAARGDADARDEDRARKHREVWGRCGEI